MPSQPNTDRKQRLRARVGAIILNYRTAELTIDCIESVVPELDPRHDELVVVDNASGDGSAERIRAEIDWRGWPVRLIEAPTNGGFASGNNIGIRAIDAESYLLLNSDSRVLPGAVKTLRAALQADPWVGIVGPRILGGDGQPEVSCFNFPTPVAELLDGARTGPLDRLLSRWVVAIPPERAPREPEWISFAAVLIRREALLSAGPLDEGFFLYFEDVEWCHRARKAGWKIVHEPAAEVVHLHGKSTGVHDAERERRRRPRYWYAARSRWFRTAGGQVGLLAANALRTLGHGVALAREVLGSKPPHAAERELVDCWRG
jgi:N-acetylglucosaminyl-diphospho-decaprenol L-rhamnosyltransferase